MFAGNQKLTLIDEGKNVEVNVDSTINAGRSLN